MAVFICLLYLLCSPLCPSRDMILTWFQAETPSTLSSTFYRFARRQRNPYINHRPHPRNGPEIFWPWLCRFTGKYLQSLWTHNTTILELDHNEVYLDYCVPNTCSKLFPAFLTRYNLQMTLIYIYGTTGPQGQKGLMYLKIRVAYKSELFQDKRKHPKVKRHGKICALSLTEAEWGNKRELYIDYKHNTCSPRTGAPMEVFKQGNMPRCRRKKNGNWPSGPAALEKSGNSCCREGRAGGTVLQGSTASPRLSSFGQGQVCGLQLLCLLADVLLYYVALS